MKTFIFATDFSQHARQALLYSIPLIKQLKGQIILFHAYEYPSAYVEMPPYLFTKLSEDMKNNAQKELDSLVKLVNETDPHLVCSYKTRMGPFVGNLMDIVEEHDGDLGIILGTKGASGLKKAFVGSNAAEVIGNVSCPVIAIPDGQAFEGITTIVYATDYQEENAFILKQLRDFALTFDAHIEILYVALEDAPLNFEVYEWYQEAVKEILPADKVSFHVVPAKNVHTGITEFVEKTKPQLLVMATHKQGWFKRLFKGSETLRQAYQIQQSLLVFHAGVNEKPLLHTVGDERNA